MFFLELRADKWQWSKPLVHGTDRPLARTEHAALKISTNDVAIFGGWATGPMNDFWVFDTVDMEWREPAISGIRPRPRYRHTCELLGSVLYILGGSDNNEDEPDGDIVSYMKICDCGVNGNIYFSNARLKVLEYTRAAFGYDGVAAP